MGGRRAFILISLALLCGGAPRPVPAQTVGAQAIVKDTTSEILRLLRDNLELYQSDPARFHDVVEKRVLPHFDFEVMSRLAVGSENWRNAQAGQRSEFVGQFRELLVRTYASFLLRYRGEAVLYRPNEVLEGGRVE